MRWTLILALAACAAPGASGDDEADWFEIRTEGGEGERVFAVEGELPVPDGTDVVVSVRLDGSEVPAGPRRAQVAERRFRALFPAGASRILPGLYMVRVRVLSTDRAEGTRSVAYGSPEEEAALRVAQERWLATVSRHLESLASDLEASADGRGRLPSEWTDRLGTIEVEIRGALDPSVTFALYRADEMEQVLVDAAVLRLLATDAERLPGASETDRELSRLGLQSVRVRRRTLSGDAPPEEVPIRTAILQWISAARSLEREAKGRGTSGASSGGSWIEAARSRLADAGRIDLERAEAIPAFEGMGALRQVAEERLGGLLASLSARRAPDREAWRAAEESIRAIETRLLDENRTSGEMLDGIQRDLEALSAAMDAGRAPERAELERVLERLAGEAAAFHHPERVVRLRTAANCLLEILRHARPDRDSVPEEKRRERIAYFQRTLRESLAASGEGREDG